MLKKVCEIVEKVYYFLFFHVIIFILESMVIILSLIEFKNVTKQYKNGVTALYELSLEIEKGDFVFIIGSSGGGKSTLIKLLYSEYREYLYLHQFSYSLHLILLPAIHFLLKT